MAGQIAGLDVSRETSERLAVFEALVAKWTSRINLISAATVSDIRTRHTLDSAQLYRFAPPGFTSWADFGAGAGFPGVVMAILAAELNPQALVTLVESDQRKAAFLRNALREVGVTGTVIAQRAETIAPLGADVVSARALGSLSSLLPLAIRHMTPGGVALFPKGRRATAEIAAARRDWTFDYADRPSITDPEARILRIERISRA